MKVIKVNLINDPGSLITVTKDDTSVVLPAINELDLQAALESYQTTFDGLNTFYFVTESASNVASITLQNTEVNAVSTTMDYTPVISDDMPEGTEPSSTIITYLEALALL